MATHRPRPRFGWTEEAAQHDQITAELDNWMKLETERKETKERQISEAYERLEREIELQRKINELQAAIEIFEQLSAGVEIGMPPQAEQLWTPNQGASFEQSSWGLPQWQWITCIATSATSTLMTSQVLESS